VTLVIDNENDSERPGTELDIASVRGMIPALAGQETVDFDELIDEAMADHAEQFVRRMREESTVIRVTAKC
jgi:hypothetical protein